MIGVNKQANTTLVPKGIKQLYILDAGANFPVDSDIYCVRLMDWHDYYKLPRHTICCIWNEDDDGQNRSWRLPALLTIKQARSDLQLYYGAERPGIDPDLTVLQHCDGLMIHVAQGQMPSKDFFSQTSLPVIVSEYEFDSNNSNRWSQLINEWPMLLEYNIPIFLFIWEWRNPPANIGTRLDIVIAPYQITNLLLNANQKESPMAVGLSIGPGVDQWIKDHQATPLSNENYLSPDFSQSVTAVRVGNAQGQPEEGFIMYDKASGSLQYFEQG